MKQVQAPCSSCVRKTSHDILFEKAQQDDGIQETYVLLECRGCSTISMGLQILYGGDGRAEHRYYPSPVSRKKPSWLWMLSFGLIGKKGEDTLGSLLSEIYEAVDGGQHRLAAMGIRALLEQVMIAKVGDLRSFEEKMDAFQKGGYISLIQRDAMKTTIDVGHAAMHRAFKPTEKELKVALDIVEGILAPLFDHKDAAQELADRVPPRPSRKPKG
jgi:hypothetical protein